MTDDPGGAGSLRCGRSLGRGGALPLAGSLRRTASYRIAASLLLGLVASTGCASLPDARAPIAVRGGPDADRVERPEQPAEYDVLVAEFALFEGKTEVARDAFLRAAAKDPESAYLQLRVGRLQAQLDELESALEYTERAVELEPDNEEARLFLARLHRIRRDLPGVERALRGADGAPVSAGAALLLFQVYVERGMVDRALVVAQDLVASDPENLGGQMALATAYERLGRPQEAEQAIRAALSHHPDRFVLYNRLARMYRAAGDREREIAVYREVLEARPYHYGTLVSLGEAQIAQNDLEGALETYAVINERYPEDLQSIRRRASLEFAAGRYAEAAARLEEALRRHPEQFELAYSLGQVLRGMGDDDAAREAFDRVGPQHPIYIEARMQIASIDEDAGDYASALVEVNRIRELRPNRALDYHAAALLAHLGDFDGAVALLQEILEEDPTDDEVLFQIGVLYGSEKRIDEAIAYMQEALVHNPNNAQALNYIGYTWAERGENLDEAEVLIRRALEQRPNDGYITDSLGWVYYMRALPLLASNEEQGRSYLEEARQQLYRAVELTGGDPVVSEHIGDVYRMLDEKERALEYYDEAVRMKHRPDEQPHLLDKREQLRRELESQ